MLIVMIINGNINKFIVLTGAMIQEGLSLICVEVITLTKQFSVRRNRSIRLRTPNQFVLYKNNKAPLYK
jgi:hypothetical protein